MTFQFKAQFTLFEIFHGFIHSYQTVLDSYVEIIRDCCLMHSLFCFACNQPKRVWPIAGRYETITNP